MWLTTYERSNASTQVASNAMRQVTSLQKHPYVHHKFLENETANESVYLMTYNILSQSVIRIRCYTLWCFFQKTSFCWCKKQTYEASYWYVTKFLTNEKEGFWFSSNHILQMKWQWLFFRVEELVLWTLSTRVFKKGESWKFVVRFDEWEII